MFNDTGGYTAVKVLLPLNRHEQLVWRRGAVDGAITKGKCNLAQMDGFYLNIKNTMVDLPSHAVANT